MAGDNRKSGIDIIGDVAWGTHLCMFYSSSQDLVDILVPYFEAGLKNNELCVWVCWEPLLAQEATIALGKKLKNLSAYISKGQIEILDYSKRHTTLGKTGFDEMVHFWVDKETLAFEKGFQGLRLTGNTSWLAPEEWADFMRYESEVDKVIHAHRMLAICPYSLDRCNATELIDVVNHHQFALIRRQNKWEILEGTERKRAEQALHISYQFLEIANQHLEMTSLLQEFIKVLKEWTNCAAVGIRMLDDEGNIPYEAYQGFSQTFYNSESALSIKSDQCMCINVVKGTTDSKLSFYTEGGSFYMNTTSRFLATVSEEEKGKTRNVCNASGYESVALIPIRFGTSILGLVHIADFRENMVPLELVQTLERVGMELGSAIHRIWLTQSLKENEEKFRAVYESSPIGVELYDEDGALLEANTASLNIFGVYDLPKARVRLFDDWNIGDEAKEALQQGRTVTYEATIDFEEVKKRQLYTTNRSGIIHIRAFITPLGMRQGEKPGGYLVILQDTTESKKLDELKDEFIGLVSHELRTPMTVIMGALNVLLTSEASLSVEERHDLLQDAASETEELSAMLTNLLELSRAQAGRLSLRTESVSIDTVIKGVVEKLRQQSPTHEFKIDLPRRLPRIHADTQRLEHILRNLLDNAVKYSPQGSEIRVFGKEDDRHVIIGVSDQGRGISPDDQAKLFQPFERVMDGALDAIKGTGLGLLVCRRLVEAHGGRIWLESEPGRGSTFYFSLPMDEKGT